MRKAEKHEPASMNTVEYMNTKTGQLRASSEKKRQYRLTETQQQADGSRYGHTQRAVKQE